MSALRGEFILLLGEEDFSLVDEKAVLKVVLTVAKQVQEVLFEHPKLVQEAFLLLLLPLKQLVTCLDVHNVVPSFHDSQVGARLGRLVIRQPLGEIGRLASLEGLRIVMGIAMEHGYLLAGVIQSGTSLMSLLVDVLRLLTATVLLVVETIVVLSRGSTLHRPSVRVDVGLESLSPPLTRLLDALLKGRVGYHPLDAGLVGVLLQLEVLITWTKGLPDGRKVIALRTQVARRGVLTG